MLGGGRQLQVVSADELLLGQSVQQLPQPQPVAQVQQGGGLVQDQHAGVHGEHRGQGHELALTAREVEHRVVRAVRQAHAPQPLHGLLLAFRTVADAAAQGQLDVLHGGGHEDL